MFLSLVKKEAMTWSMEETIYLGGGCFWCTEAVFSEIRGVKKVEPGYSGGDLPNPTYEQVCTGKTGHAEVVKVTFDQELISLEDILEVFFATHDPTSLNRQGNDIGTQYRSIILYTNDKQLSIIEKVKERVQSKLSKKIVTEVAPFKAFYPAEDYHKNYFRKNPNQPYCRFVIAPKVLKVRKHFEKFVKE